VVTFLSLSQNAIALILQEGARTTGAATGTLRELYEFIRPYNEYLIILFVFWLFARRGRPKQGDFNRQAQDVLDQKYREGEISKKTYDKFRQDISLRPKR
jgi:uncharacterized membrane protein